MRLNVGDVVRCVRSAEYPGSVKRGDLYRVSDISGYGEFVCVLPPDCDDKECGIGWLRASRFRLDPTNIVPDDILEK